MLTDFAALGAELARIPNRRRVGRVTAVGTAALEIAAVEPLAVSWRTPARSRLERGLIVDGSGGAAGSGPGQTGGAGCASPRRG